MSRLSSGGDQILVKPTNNVYTVLVVVAIVAEILAFVATWVAAGKLFGPNTTIPWG
ncbi:MAG TPA: hypothetical protein VFE47_11690 [Tepidisphaeraceae bacterium]|jgi:hypothetical protein|nr:hypothetical protein [Tepidisphaeraceae bacterium]